MFVSKFNGSVQCNNRANTGRQGNGVHDEEVPAHHPLFPLCLCSGRESEMKMNKNLQTKASESAKKEKRRLQASISAETDKKSIGKGRKKAVL